MKERTRQTLRQIRIRATALLIICAMAVTSMSTFAGMDVFAATSGKCGDNLTWTFDEESGLLTISGSGDMWNYAWRDSKIKSVKFNGAITSIGNYAFEYCSSLTSITIPNTVTSIGNSAFERCSSLTSITIPNSVTSIGDDAFWSCSSLTSITIPDSVTSIGERAFGGCSNLTSITIPNSVTSIGDHAFNYCSSLTSINVKENNKNYYSNDGILYNKDFTKLITYPGGKSGSFSIPNSVTSICDYAFYFCDSLTSVTIGNSVTSIGEFAFERCSSLTSITIPNSVTSIGRNAFERCSSLTSITIPNSVTYIEMYAFYGCSSLTSITIPNSATYIGFRAFEDCSSLTSITIPDSVTSIGDHAFHGCSSLTSVTIGNSVTYIGNAAFADCNSLTSITIPDSVTSIDMNAFYGCSSLTSITIPDSVKSIGHGAFYHCSSLTSVTIGNSVTSIGNGAFEYCSSLTSINVEENNKNYSSNDGVLYNKNFTELIVCPGGKSGSFSIPNSVTSICDDAFYLCDSLTSVTIGNSVTSIGDYAFWSCSSLTSVAIGNSVTSIGRNAFYNCSSLSDIYIYNSNCEIYDYSGTIQSTAVIHGFKDSTAEAYAKKYNRKFVELTAATVSQTPVDTTEKYVITIVDSDKKPIAGAKVTLGSTAVTTDSNGQASFTVKDMDKAYYLSVESDNYDTYEPGVYRLKSTKSDCIQMRDIITCVLIDYKNAITDLLTTKKTIDMKYKNTKLAISVITNSRLNVKEIYIRGSDGKNNIRLDTALDDSSGKTIGTLDCEIKNFKAGYTYYAYCVLKDGSTKRVKIQLEVVDTTNDEEFSYEFEDAQVKLGDGFGGIFSNATIAIPAISQPILHKVTDDKVCIGFNLYSYEGSNEDTEEANIFNKSDIDFAKEWKEIKKNFSKYASDFGKSKGNKSSKCEFNVCMYAEGTYDDPSKGLSGVKDWKGKISVEFKYKSTFTWQWTVLTGEFEFTGKAGFESNFIITSLEPLNNAADLLLKAGVTIEISAGVGLAKVASVQVYGGGELSFDFIIGSTQAEKGLSKAELDFYWGAKWKVLFVESKKEFARKKIMLYSRDVSLEKLSGQRSSGTSKIQPLIRNVSASDINTVSPSDVPDNARESALNVSSVQARASAVNDVYDLEQYKPTDRSYLKNTSAWLSTNNQKNKARTMVLLNSDDGFQTLQTSTYTGIEPQVVSCGNTAMMVYCDDDSSRSDNNRTAVVYSIYNASTGSWSAPQQIDNDGTADFNPVAYADGNDIWVVWQDASEKISDTAEVNEVSRKMELCASKYDTATGKWSAAVNITNNSQYEMQQHITSSDDKIYITWIVNNDEDIFGQTANNSLYYSVYSEGSWSGAHEFAAGLNAVAAADAGVLGGTVYAAVCEDSDCDLSTDNDIELYLYSLSGEKVRLTSNDIAEANPNFVTLNGAKKLSWTAGGNMNVIGAVSDKPVALLDEENAFLENNAKLITSGDNAAIIYTHNIDSAAQLYAVTYDSQNNTWGNPIPETDQSLYINKADGAYVNGELIVAFNQTEAVVSDDELTETNSLCWMKLNSYTDIAITDIYIDYSAVIPGSEAEFEITVANNGELTVNGLTVEISDPSGNVISDSTIDSIIRSGASDTVNAKFTVPSDVTKGEYKVCVKPKNTTDQTISDNSKNIRIGYADLDVEAAKVIINNSEMLMITVDNDGCIPTGGKLSLVKENGNEFYTMDIPTLNCNESIQYTVDIDNDIYYIDGTTTDVVEVRTVSNEEEAYTENNNQRLVLIKRESYISSLSLIDSADIKVNENLTLDAQITTIGTGTCSVKWQSSNENVATVDENGTVHGIKAGKAIITLSSADGGLSETCEVQVISDSCIEIATSLPSENQYVMQLIKSDGTAYSIESENSDGTTTFSVEAPAGTYELRITAPGYTTYTDKSFVLGTDKLPETIEIYVGDINGDNIINAKDSAILSAAFGTRKGSDGFNSNADLNGDGIINAKDKAILSANFTRRSVEVA